MANRNATSIPSQSSAETLSSALSLARELARQHEILATLAGTLESHLSPSDGRETEDPIGRDLSELLSDQMSSSRGYIRLIEKLEALTAQMVQV